MKELREIVDAMRNAPSGTGLLATVVETSGSTYRGPGARMLVLDDGSSAGSISGGCLEADVIERGRGLAAGSCAVVTYDTRSDADVVWGLGLGCNGVVTVLVERVERDSLDWLGEALDLRRRVVCARVVSAGDESTALAGATLVLRSDGNGDELVTGDWPPELIDSVRKRAREALATGISRTVRLDMEVGNVAVFVESIDPPLRLVIFGAGQDAIPLVRQAAMLGWDVTVADHRPVFATAARFPEARDVVCVRSELARERVGVDERTAVVVMTHNLVHDRALVEWLVGAPAFYVGVLGPRRRTERLVAELSSTDAESLLARLHAPTGLDIGAESPEQIALAIVAEIEAVRAGHAAGFLRDRRGAIHDSEPNPERRFAPHSRAPRAEVGIVVLAAGGSSRLGTPKQLLMYGDRSLLRRSAETAVDARIGPVVVVLGAGAEQLSDELDGLNVAIVENAEWRNGIGSSIRAGVQRVLMGNAAGEAVVLMLCDQPLVTPNVIRRLVERYRETRAPIVACAYGDTLGVPALFDAECVDDLLRLPDGQGAKDLIASFGSRVASIHVPAAVVDVDTQDDYAQLLATHV